MCATAGPARADRTRRSGALSCSPWWPPGRRRSSRAAGWIVTEVGRQPWIVYRVMRVPEALTSQTGLATYLYATAVIYWCSRVALVAILRRIAGAPPRPTRRPAPRYATRSRHEPQVKPCEWRIGL